jgi:hypothetical protein
LPDARDGSVDEDFRVGLDGSGAINAALFGVVGLEGLKRGARIEEGLEHGVSLHRGGDAVAQGGQIGRWRASRGIFETRRYFLAVRM